MHAILALLRVNLRLYLRNRKALLMNLVVPILIASFFGSLFGSPGGPASPIALGMVDEDGSPLSQAIVDGLAQDASLKVQRLSRDEARARVMQGKLPAAIVLPQGFGEQAPAAMLGGGKPVVEVWVDPSDKAAPAVVNGLFTQRAMQAVMDRAFNDPGATRRMRQQVDANPAIPADKREALDALYGSLAKVQQIDASQVGTAGGAAGGAAAGTTTGDPAGGRPAGASASADPPARRGGLTQPFEIAQQAVTGTRTGYNGYAHSFAGMGAQFVLMMAVELGTGLLLMRRTGLWTRLRASPMTRGQLLAGYFLSTTLIASVVLALAMGAGMAMFGFRPDGAWLGWAGLVVAYGGFVAACGLALAALGRDPESTRGLAIMVTLLMVMLGGAWVPSFMFPAWLQQVTLFVPVRHAVDGFDAVLWRGLGSGAALLPIAVLVGSSALLMAVALWKFEWNE